MHDAIDLVIVQWRGEHHVVDDHGVQHRLEIAHPPEHRFIAEGLLAVAVEREIAGDLAAPVGRMISDALELGRDRGRADDERTPAVRALVGGAPGDKAPDEGAFGDEREAADHQERLDEQPADFDGAHHAQRAEQREAADDVHPGGQQRNTRRGHR